MQKPGDSDSILVATGENELKVLFELEQQSKIIKQEWITLSREQKFFSIPIVESYRGNVTVHLLAVKNNREYRQSFKLNVPWTNKTLKIFLETSRTKVTPGSKEEWKVSVKDAKGNKAAAEMLASMYDASLDAFLPHQWSFDIYPHFDAYLPYVPHSFGAAYSWLFCKDWNEPVIYKDRTYDELNWFGFRGFGYSGDVRPMMAGAADRSMQAEVEMTAAAPMAKNGNADETKSEKPPKPAPPVIKARSNFNETVFFSPQMQTDANGEIKLAFTMPDALTRWKLSCSHIPPISALGCRRTKSSHKKSSWCIQTRRDSCARAIRWNCRSKFPRFPTVR
jgi:hypothetical protein